MAKNNNKKQNIFGDIDPSLKENMTAFSQALDESVNGKGPIGGEIKYGFIIMVFEVGEPKPDSKVNYSANITRETAVPILKQFIDHSNAQMMFEKKDLN